MEPQRTFIAAIAALALSLPASAETRYAWQSKTSGSVLMDLCPPDRQTGRYDPCGALLVGLIDGLSAGGVYCAPENFTIPQGEEVILSYVRRSPEKWHHPSAFLAWQALSKAFPCPIN